MKNNDIKDYKKLKCPMRDSFRKTNQFQKNIKQDI